ncbi:MAG TPA: vgr related protein [Sphingomicrobium sp.]|nr:vgr related protein [Sphingomicrobium sp.]
MTESRSLTPGEIEIARSVFGGAIDYSKVRLVNRKWWPFQPRNAAMAPCGSIHFNPHGNLWSEDFSKERLPLQAFFIHEMTHVWQTQKRGRFYLPLMRHPFCRYDYEIVPGRRFEDYGLEQQAEIVSHVFLHGHGARPDTPPRSLLPF